MTTSADLANEALQECASRASISALTDNTKEARIVSAFYASTRDAMLREAHWNFARAFAQLTLIKALPGTPENPGAPLLSGWQPIYPAIPWAYAYAQPADCVRVRFIIGQSNAGVSGLSGFLVPSYGSVNTESRSFIVGTDIDSVSGNTITVILTNQSKAMAVYTRSIVNENLWDAQFHQAFVKALASRLAVPLSGDKALKKILFDEAKQMIVDARVSDGNEDTTLEEHIPDWIRVRGLSWEDQWRSSVSAPNYTASSDFSNLPTTLPAQAGVLWNNGGVICIS